MRTVLALAALAAAAASSAQAQSTCTNSSLAFITETTGPFAQICAAAVTAPALAPYSATVSLTTLLDPTASVTSFLVSSPVTTAVNAALNAVLSQFPAPFNNISALTTTTGGVFSAYPASTQNPYGYNYTRLSEILLPLLGSTNAQKLVDGVNGTVLGASNFVLCPVLKNITQSLIGCVPSACNNLALNLCNNPTQANAASLMGSYADKPFTAGTLTILANIGASCGGAYQFFTNSQTAAVVALLQSLGYNAGATASTFDVSCSVLANPALAGTYQYPTTKSPTTKSSGAVVGAGVLAAVAAVASVVAF